MIFVKKAAEMRKTNQRRRSSEDFSSVIAVFIYEINKLLKLLLL